MNLRELLEEKKLGLTIFDIDETLMRTTAKIKVVKNGREVRSLTNQEFNSYQLKPGEEFDFGEFRNAKKFQKESEPIGPMIAKLKAILNNAGDSKVIMLTARADFDDKETFLDTFRKLGIDMNRVHVHRAGNLGGSPAASKAVWIRKYLDTGKYGRVRLYDDAASNIKMFNALAKEYPDIKFFPYLVTHDGRVKTVRESAKIKDLFENNNITDNKNGWGAVPNNQEIDYLGLRVSMTPETFIKLASPLGSEPSEKIVQHIAQGGKIGSPFLSIEIPESWMDGDLSMPARVAGHEGRNRMLAVAKVLGNTPIEVHLFFSQGLRNRHITDDFKKVLNKGLVKEKSNSIIKGPLFGLNESIDDQFKYTVAENKIKLKKPSKFYTAIVEGYKLQLERDKNMLVLNIKDTATGRRTEVRGKLGYETGGYDADDTLHQLLDIIGKSANVSELINGETVTINPKHPDAKRALAATDRAYNESFDTDVEWIKDFDDGDVKVFATKVEDAYIELTYKRMTNGDLYIAFSRGGRSSVTGEGTQNKIFGAVINHIKSHVTQAKPPRIIFSAFKPNTGAFGSQDTTRSSLYRRMVQRFASQNGYAYDVEDTGNEDTFILTRQVSENSNVKYLDPNFEHEWEEAKRYPEFRKLGKQAWIELASKGKALTIQSAKGINNTDAADPDSFKLLDKDKQSRALAQLKSGTVEMPVVAVYPDGWKELVGGNTRLTAMLAQNGKATVWAFKVPDEVTENFADRKKQTQGPAKAEERYTAREWSIISGGHSLEEAKPKTKLFDFGKY
jgi:hypothetical protein